MKYKQSYALNDSPNSFKVVPKINKKTDNITNIQTPYEVSRNACCESVCFSPFRVDFQICYKTEMGSQALKTASDLVPATTPNEEQLQAIPKATGESRPWSNCHCRCKTKRQAPTGSQFKNSHEAPISEKRRYRWRSQVPCQAPPKPGCARPPPHSVVPEENIAQIIPSPSFPEFDNPKYSETPELHPPQDYNKNPYKKSPSPSNPIPSEAPSSALPGPSPPTQPSRDSPKEPHEQSPKSTNPITSAVPPSALPDPSPPQNPSGKYHEDQHKNTPETTDPVFPNPPPPGPHKPSPSKRPSSEFHEDEYKKSPQKADPTTPKSPPPGLRDPLPPQRPSTKYREDQHKTSPQTTVPTSPEPPAPGLRDPSSNKHPSSDSKEDQYKKPTQKGVPRFPQAPHSTLPKSSYPSPPPMQTVKEPPLLQPIRLYSIMQNIRRSLTFSLPEKRPPRDNVPNDELSDDPKYPSKCPCKCFEKNPFKISPKYPQTDLPNKKDVNPKNPFNLISNELLPENPVCSSENRPPGDSVPDDNDHDDENDKPSDHPENPTKYPLKCAEKTPLKISENCPQTNSPNKKPEYPKEPSNRSSKELLPENPISLAEKRPPGDSVPDDNDDNDVDEPSVIPQNPKKYHLKRTKKGPFKPPPISPPHKQPLYQSKYLQSYNYRSPVYPNFSPRYQPPPRHQQLWQPYTCTSTSISKCQCRLLNCCRSNECSGSNYSCPYGMEDSWPVYCPFHESCRLCLSACRNGCHFLNNQRPSVLQYNSPILPPTRGKCLAQSAPGMSVGNLLPSSRCTPQSKVSNTPGPKSKCHSKIEKRSFPSTKKTLLKQHQRCKVRKSSKTTKPLSSKQSNTHKWPFPRSVPDVSTMLVSHRPPKQIPYSKLKHPFNYRHKDTNDSNFKRFNLLRNNDQQYVSFRRYPVVYLSHNTDDDVKEARGTHNCKLDKEIESTKFSETMTNCHNSGHTKSSFQRSMEAHGQQKKPTELTSYSYSADKEENVHTKQRQTVSCSMGYMDETVERYLQKYSSREHFLPKSDFCKNVIIPTIGQFLKLS